MSQNVSSCPSARPADGCLFAPTRDRYGVRLALVFGNHASGGQCVYYAAGNCHHCDIGGGEGAAFTSELNRQRLIWFREHYGDVLSEVVHLVLYNSGSFLNPREMPTVLLDEILDWARSLPALKVLSLETRESMVTDASVRRVVDALGHDRTVRIILGLETSNDYLRNEILAKAMPKEAVRKAVAAIGVATAELGCQRIGLTFNILVGGPGTTPLNATDDALSTAQYALDCGRDANVAVDLNLHPYYRSVRGQLQFPTHFGCTPPMLARVAAEIAQRTVSVMPPCVLFLGTNDEGHDGSSVLSRWCIDAIRKTFEEFNHSQNPAVLDFLCRAE